MAKGLLNPKNAAPDTGGGGFKEGHVRVDKSIFKVHKAPDPQNPGKDYVSRPAVLALIWDVTRLDDNLEPMVDEHESPLTETLTFGLGGKSLPQVHPGGADSADDEEIEDLGDAVGTEGKTIFMVNTNFQIHPKSTVHFLFKSLVGKVDDKFLDRVWAPDWDGMVAFMKNQDSGEKMMQKDKEGKDVERPLMYKVVEKVVSMGSKKKGSAAAAGKGASDKSSEAETKLKPILEAISTELDGEDAITLKALASRVSKALQKSDVDTKLHVPILALIKDDEWLKKNGKPGFDMNVDFEDRTVSFGKAA